MAVPAVVDVDVVMCVAVDLTVFITHRCVIIYTPSHKRLGVVVYAQPHRARVPFLLVCLC